MNFLFQETYVDGEIRGLVDALKKSQDDDRNNGRDVVFTDDRIRANIPETVVSGAMDKFPLTSMVASLVILPKSDT